MDIRPQKTSLNMNTKNERAPSYTRPAYKLTKITHSVAGLVYDEKGNMGIGIIYTRINVGGYIIIIVPYLDIFSTL